MINYFGLHQELSSLPTTIEPEARDGRSNQPYVWMACRPFDGGTAVIIEASELAFEPDQLEHFAFKIAGLIDGDVPAFGRGTASGGVWLGHRAAFVSPERVQTVLSAMPGVAEASAMLVDGELRARLSLRRGTAPPSSDELREMAALDPTFISPDLVSATVVDDVESEFAPRDVEEDPAVLADVLRAVGEKINEPSPDMSFYAQGGRFTDLSGVVMRLRSMGIKGASIQRFSHSRSLRAVSRILARSDSTSKGFF